MVLARRFFPRTIQVLGSCLYVLHENAQQAFAFPDPGSSNSFQPRSSSSGFRCQYPSGWESCNTPEDRSCWIRNRKTDQKISQFDIHTEYEFEWPQGVHREYEFEVSDKAIAPDGYLKEGGKVVNGEYPGPIIEACWGDEITLRVKNNLKENGTSIHFHGIRQLNTNQMDGVVGMTQCPIPNGDTFTYNFKAIQYGHTWWHSHYSLQYSDGVVGPLLIHGPTSGNWDEELEPIIISDWIHANPYQTFLLETMRKAPQLDSIVVNGHGKFICDKTDPKCIGGSSPYTGIFKKGKRYLLRLVNTSTESTFIVSLDKHILEVVSNDLVAIEPYKTKSLHLGIGQRYSVIVEADPTESTSDGAYWLRTTVAQGCGDVTQRNETTAVIRYDEKSTNLPTSDPWNYSILCQDEPYENLKPIVPWEVASSPANADDDPYRADLNVTYPDGKILDHWRLANHTLWIDYSDPTILDLDNATWNPSSNVAEYDYDNKWVYIVLQANWTKATADFLGGLKNHPIHLHGHDFAILAQSNETYDEIESTKKFNFHNPPRRDSALLPINGYLAIAFKTDNPGVWLLHCHLAWHIANGLGVQILERQYDIDNALGSLDSTKEVCTAWNSWFKDNPFEKLDSGL